jgi:hypothetical protein
MGLQRVSGLTGSLMLNPERRLLLLRDRNGDHLGWGTISAAAIVLSAALLAYGPGTEVGLGRRRHRRCLFKLGIDNNLSQLLCSRIRLQ